MRMPVLTPLLLVGCAHPPGAESPCPPATVQTAALSTFASEVDRRQLPACPFGHASVRRIPRVTNGITGTTDDFDEATCLQCGYSHSARDPDYVWRKRAPDPCAFQAPLNALTISFPLIAPESKPQYTQTVQLTRPTRESVLYRASQPPAALEPQLVAWFSVHRLRPTRANDASALTLSAPTHKGMVRVELTPSSDQSTTRVLLDVVME